MDINRQNLDALFKTIVAGFQAGMTQAPPVDLSFAVTQFPSSTATNLYPFLEKIPGFREWIGARQFKALRGQKFEVTNRDFELSLGMPSKDIEDDTYGIYATLTQAAAAEWPMLLYSLLVEVLTNRVKGWDGALMFADAHKYGANTIDNLTTNALTASNLETAILAAAEWKFSDGTLCQPTFTHLYFGPKLEFTAWDIIQNQFRYDGTDKVQIGNRNYKRLIPVKIPALAADYDDYWGMLDCSKGIKPVLTQIRKTPNVTMTTDLEWIARTGEVDIMADGRAAAAPTFFHLAYGAVL